MNFDPTPYQLGSAFLQWLMVMGGLFGVVLLVGLIVSLIANGKRGPRLLLRQLGEGTKDFVTISPRRVFALTQLTFREAIRRKALYVFFVFAILFMFGGWFLSDSNFRPELQVKVYLKFVLTAIHWLVLLVMLLLACWGLPADIKDRSLHTVVTKPVRRNEVILGRMLGYITVGTVVLLFMGLVGYVWINRQVPEQAQDQLTSRIPIYGRLFFTDQNGHPTAKGVNTGDIWEFRSSILGASDASAIWDYMEVTPEQISHPDGSIKFESHFEAFRTHKGKMGEGLYVQIRITNRLRREFAWAMGYAPQLNEVTEELLQDQFKEAGETMTVLATQLRENTLKSVPKQPPRDPNNPDQPPPTPEVRDITAEEYAFMANGFADAHGIIDYLRRYLEEHDTDADWTQGLLEALAASRDAAKEAFEVANDRKPVTDQHRQKLADAFDLVGAELQAQSEQLGKHLTDRVASLIPFELQEYKGNLTEITLDQGVGNLTVKDNPNQKDLFEHLVRDGRLRVEVFCTDPGQFLSMARPDLFIRTPDNPFYSGYFKAILGTWLMMVMVVVIGVTASSFVKGPVATMLTLTLVGLGSFARNFLAEVASGRFLGGGPIENYYRIIKQLNPQVPLQPGVQTTVMRALDEVIIRFLTLVKNIIPDFSYVNQMPAYVLNGFDVPWNASLLPSLAIALGIILPCLIIGHFSMKLREIESK